MENQEQESTEPKIAPEQELPETPKDVASNLEEKVAELNDKYLRLYSEYDNYRKRTAKEKLDLMVSAGEDVYKLILPVIDDFERAIRHNEAIEDAAPIKEGFLLIFNKLKNSVTQKGLMPIDPQKEVFNADLHEAITEIPAPSEKMIGKVIDMVEPGYYLNDKLIRHAKVVVGK